MKNGIPKGISMKSLYLVLIAVSALLVFHSHSSAQSNSFDFSITATPDPVKPGELITYGYTVTNRGATDLAGVVLSTSVPDHTRAMKV